MKLSQGTTLKLAAITFILVITLTCTYLGVSKRPFSSLEATCKFDSDTVSFGTLRQCETVSREVRLTNSLDSPLEIVGWKTSCSCTAAPSLRSNILSPGESITFPLSFSAEQREGRISGSLVVLTRCPDDPKNLMGRKTYAKVEVDAFVSPEFSVSDRQLDFGVVRTLETVERVIVLEPVELKQLELNSISCNNPAFSITNAEETKDSNGKITLLVRFEPEKVSRRQLVTGTVSIDVKSPNLRAPTLIQVKANYAPPVEVSPALIVVDSDVKGDIHFPIRLTSDFHGDFEVQVVDSDCQVEFGDSHREGNTVVIDAWITDLSVGYSGSIKIEVDMGESLIDLSIPVSRLK